MVHEGPDVVNSQRQLEILLEQKVFEKQDMLLHSVVISNRPEAWRNEKIGREHTLQNVLAGRLIRSVNFALKKISLVRQIRDSFRGFLRSGDNHRQVADFVVPNCSRLRNDNRNENEYPAPQTQHIPVKRLE